MHWPLKIDQAVSSSLLLVLTLLFLQLERSESLVGDTTSVVQDVEISYVIDPFETVIDKNLWFGTSDGNVNDGEAPVSLSLSNDSVYGSHSLLIEILGQPTDDLVASSKLEFGWIHPTRPHNGCVGATHISFWVKVESLAPAHAEDSLKVILLDDSACIGNNNDCGEPTNLEPHVIADLPIMEMHNITDSASNDDKPWHHIQVPTADFATSIDLRRLRGWKVELSGLETSAGSATAAGSVAASTTLILLDHVECFGRGVMLGSALNLVTTFEQALAEGTWQESLQDSESAQAASEIVTTDDGDLTIDYAIEKVNDDGGLSQWYTLATGNGYFNLSQASDLIIDYDIVQAASTEGHSVFRFLLFDASSCQQDCDLDTNSVEQWYYSNSDLLDQQGTGQLVIPLSEMSLLTDAVLGNGQLDMEHIKGFNMKFSLLDGDDDVQDLELGSLIEGSVSFQAISAAVTPSFQDTQVSYVVDPFDVMTDTWKMWPPPPEEGNNSGMFLNVTLSEDALFGLSSLLVEYHDDSIVDEEETSAYFEDILPIRLHNCHGAQYLSLWYKCHEAPHLRLIMYDDDGLDCLAQNCSESESLRPTVLFDELLYESGEEWLEIRLYDFATLNLQRIKGWRVEMDTAGSFYLDQLACVGGGSMFGAAFYSGTENLEQAVAEMTWEDEYYQSDISRNNTLTTLQNGRLAVNYTVEQVENWGGFLLYSHAAPGVSYYNMSQASNLIFSYDVVQASSSPGRVLLRSILQDTSNCTMNCDGPDKERWYSFHSVLDEAGPGQVLIPLVGSTEPTTPFWLTGWAGTKGNSRLDLDKIHGFIFEFSVDGELGVGNLVTGSVEIFDLAVTAGRQDETAGEDLDKCVVEMDIHFMENAPQFTIRPFLGAQCCEVCAGDPDCLYAISTTFGHCVTAPYLDPKYVRLLNNKIQQTTLTSFWMDDQTKRGDFCEVCDCLESSQRIDCRDRDLAIVPKSFGRGWEPKVLDLRGNPKLVLLGSGSLAAIEATLEEIFLPSSLRHIAPNALDALPMIRSVQFGDDGGSDQVLNNVITDRDRFFSDVCCGLGSTIPLDGPAGDLTFCNMQISYPGVDATYQDYIEFFAATPIAVITPSSDFMSEAAESPQKCAEFCAISQGCRFFNYDRRFKNAEHICYLLEDDGESTHEVCCDPDHFADAAQLQPGWVGGLPPRTRHELDDAKVVYSAQELEATADNKFQAEFMVSLGSTPLRGSVWIEPTLVSTTSRDLNVTITPPRFALYDAVDSATVKVQAHGIVPGTAAVTLVIRNMIISCDEAFIFSDGSTDNVVYVYLEPPEAVEDLNLSLVVILVVSAIFLVVGGGMLFWYELNRRKNDSLWKVRKEELLFSKPPKIIGRGTFGLVLLAEYRGTKVAVKRLVHPEKNVLNRRKNKCDETSSCASDHHESSECSTGVDMAGAMSRTAESQSSVVGIMASTMKSTKESVTLSEGQNRRRLRKEFIEEMRHLSVLRHPCITTVMGAVMESEEPMLVMEYMDHGSLYDLLHNNTMHIEGEMLLPILCDISQGLRFLHSAKPQILHGDLKAQNVLVDNRFRAKVADFGLSLKKNRGGVGTPYWMAPELLRGQSAITLETDVYSFGILLYEVYSRRDPYDGEEPTEVLRMVMDEQARKRPPIPAHCPPLIKTMMAECTRNDPFKRPTFEELDVRLKREEVEAVDPGNSNNAPSQISLFDIFPRHIAEALRDGRNVEPEHRDMVTIFFSDIVGFTNISSELPPAKVANMLDRLYTKFDSLSQEYDVFKVETIGDAYMAVTNLVKDQPKDHAKRVAEFAIQVVKVANQTLIDVDDPERGSVNIRVGFHSGSVVADVVGTRNPRYCLFGDTVNTASRMESSSKVNRIHCSRQSADLLGEQCPEMPLRSRGVIPIKGKGRLKTFWVNEKGVVPPKDGDKFSMADMSMLKWASDRDLPEAALDRSGSMHGTGNRREVGDVEIPREDIFVPLNDD